MPTTTLDSKALEALEESVSAKRTKLKELHEQIDRAVESAEKADDGTIVIDAEAVKVGNEAKALRASIEADELLVGEAKWGRAPERDSVAVSVAAALKALGHAPSDPNDLKSLSQRFIESPEFKHMAENGLPKMDSPFRITGNAWKSWVAKDVFSSMPSGTPASFGRVDRDPLVPMTRRSFRVRDLFPARPTSAVLIEYFRQTARTNAASTVGERSASDFALKPQSSYAFEGRQAPVRTIAHWEAAHRNTLSDEPGLQGLLDTELLYGLQLEEDNQILNGNGQGDNLAGVLNDEDILGHTQSSKVGDTKADAIRRSITKAFLSNYEATGVVLHPNDWEEIELIKETTGAYIVAAAVAIGAERRLWRLPVVETPAIAEATALVGAFGLGAQLYDRQEGSIRVADQHEDFFVRNAVVILAEERLALAVKRPDSFVKVTLDGPGG